MFIDHCLMKMINWRGNRLNIQSHIVNVGPRQLELRRCFREGYSTGPVVLMVAGFLNTTDIFLPRKGEGGLAPFFASLGYDVYLAELRGRGNSWPAITANADWGLHEAICEDLPAHLQTLERLRPGAAQYWVGEGLGSLLLAACLARSGGPPSSLRAMIHFAASRRHISTRRKTLPYQCWSLAMGLVKSLRGYAGIPFSDPPRRETRKALATWKRWLASEEWLDPVDGFDYGQVLESMHLPPSLYFANGASSLWGNAPDCRQWIQELGGHDGRLLTVSKQGGNEHDYSRGGLLQHPDACQDHFLELQAWLEELGSR